MNDPAATATKFLAHGRLTAFRARGLFCPAKVVAQIDSTAVAFQFWENTGTWRMTSIDTYGNHSFITGPGCDASGWVVTDSALTALLDAAMVAS